MIDVLSKKILDIAIKQDVGIGDVTSIALIPKRAYAEAYVVAKSPGILAGIEEFTYIMNGVRVKPMKKDGEIIRKNERVIHISGNARRILERERMALNILSRMSGIATQVRRLSKYIPVAATRKSPPGLMLLDKKAVEIGGGWSHRKGLWDFAIIKDNHLSYLNHA